MARLIDAEKLKEMITARVLNTGTTYGSSPYHIMQIIDEAPTITTFHVIDNKTGEEADLWEIALKEDWAKALCYCDMEGFAIEQDGTLLLLDECGRHEYCDPDRFEVIWDETD